MIQKASSHGNDRIIAIDSAPSTGSVLLALPITGRVGSMRLGKARLLLARHRQKRLRICSRDGEQRPRRSAGLLPPLLPALQRANGHAEQRRELRLRQPGFLSRLGGKSDPRVYLRKIKINFTTISEKRRRPESSNVASPGVSMPSARSPETTRPSLDAGLSTRTFSLTGASRLVR